MRAVRPFLAGVVALACSILNRSGPDVTCPELGDGAENACSDGIIATCRDGTVDWTVCDDESACDASWQTPGRYRCAETEPIPTPEGAGGSSAGSGGDSGDSLSGGADGSAAGGEPGASCDSCVSSLCSMQLSNCLGNSDCTSLYQCIESCSDEDCSTSCVVDYPSFDFGQPLRQCVSTNCSQECPLWR